MVVDQSHALPAHSNGVAAARSIFFGMMTVKSLCTTMCFEYPPVMCAWRDKGIEMKESNDTVGALSSYISCVAHYLP